MVEMGFKQTDVTRKNIVYSVMEVYDVSFLSQIEYNYKFLFTKKNRGKMINQKVVSGNLLVQK